MMSDTERDGLELEKHRREIASIVFKSETLEEISAQWCWRDGDPTTPEGARTFAARIKAATGRDVRAMFLRNDDDNGVVFAVHDIDLNAATERKERNLDAYRETYAKATAAGITYAVKPADVAFTLLIDGPFMFPHNVAEEADNIEMHNRNLLVEIEKRTLDAERRKTDEKRRADEIDTEVNKRVGAMLAAANNLTTDVPKRKKPGRKPLTPEQIQENRKRNEFITELRRRADTKGGIGNKGLSAAYDELETEADKAGSKWRTIIGLSKRTAYIDMARHNTRYKT